MRPSAILPLLLGVIASATGAAGWFETREQEGERLARDGRHAEAAAAFEDPYRRGVALYRAEDYAGSARSFERVERPERRTDARYNLGNARFRQGDVDGAAAAWTEVLESDPGHADARHNLDIARALLARAEAQRRAEQPKADPQAQKEQQQQQSGGQSQQEKQQQSGGQSQQEKQQQSGGQSQQEKQQQSGEQSQQEKQQQSGEQSQQEKQQQSGGQSQQEPQSAGGEAGESSSQSGEQKDQSSAQGATGAGQGEGESRERSEGAASGTDRGKESDPSEADLAEGARDRPDARDRGDEGDEREHGDKSTTPEAGLEEDKRMAKDGPSDGGARTGGEDRPGAEGSTAAGGGGEQAQDSRAGKNRPAAPPKGPEQFRAETATQAKAVDEFEAAGKPGPSEGEGERGQIAGGEGAAQTNLALLEQLLEQAEGAPAYLLRNQFRLEEQRALRSRGGLHEPRPW
jgi:Ca-activated chloride channel family protein